MRISATLLLSAALAACNGASADGSTLHGDLWGYRFNPPAADDSPGTPKDAAVTEARRASGHSSAPAAVDLGVLECVRREDMCAQFGEARLAWGVLWNEGGEHDYVFVDAASGEVIHRLRVGPAS